METFQLILRQDRVDGIRHAVSIRHRFAASRGHRLTACLILDELARELPRSGVLLFLRRAQISAAFLERGHALLAIDHLYGVEHPTGLKLRDAQRDAWVVVMRDTRDGPRRPLLPVAPSSRPRHVIHLLFKSFWLMSVTCGS